VQTKTKKKEKKLIFIFFWCKQSVEMKKRDKLLHFSTGFYEHGDPPTHQFEMQRNKTTGSGGRGHEGIALPGATGFKIQPGTKARTPIEEDNLRKDMRYVVSSSAARSLAAENIGGGNTTEELIEQIITNNEEEFVADFARWLAGDPTPDDLAMTPWLYNKNSLPGTTEKPVIPGDDVKKFLDRIPKAKQRFLKDLETLGETFAGGLNDSYLYYKYLVKRIPLDDTDWVKDMKTTQSGYAFLRWCFTRALTHQTQSMKQIGWKHHSNWHNQKQQQQQQPHLHPHHPKEGCRAVIS